MLDHLRDDQLTDDALDKVNAACVLEEIELSWNQLFSLLVSLRKHVARKVGKVLPHLHAVSRTLAHASHVSSPANIKRALRIKISENKAVPLAQVHHRHVWQRGVNHDLPKLVFRCWKNAVVLVQEQSLAQIRKRAWRAKSMRVIERTSL